VTALCCWWLIPLSGMDGAAYAIVAGTAVMCFVMAWYSLKVFPIPYDWFKLFLLLVMAVAMAFLQILVGHEFPQAGAVIATKTVLLTLYLAIAVALFGQEARLVAVKVAGKFSRK
jgi:O-antigen/teichoic acid export membrane protein